MNNWSPTVTKIMCKPGTMPMQATGLQSDPTKAGRGPNKIENADLINFNLLIKNFDDIKPDGQ